jgi:hypothetical protein
MKVFRELTIEGGPEALLDTLRYINESLSGGWRRNEAAESRMAPMPDNQRYYCFSCSETAGRPGAELWLYQKTPGEMLVTNIIPTSKRKLDYDEYNLIIREFHDRFLKPAALRAGTKPNLSPDQSSIEDWISPGTAHLLHTFSVLANKSSGISHPADEERWHRFLVAAHEERSELDASTLGRWLEEEEAWPEEAASDLALKYEAARSVLDFYAKQA